MNYCTAVCTILTIQRRQSGGVEAKRGRREPPLLVTPRSTQRKYYCGSTGREERKRRDEWRRPAMTSDWLLSVPALQGQSPLRTAELHQLKSQCPLLVLCTKHEHNTKVNECPNKNPPAVVKRCRGPRSLPQQPQPLPPTPRSPPSRSYRPAQAPIHTPLRARFL